MTASPRRHISSFSLLLSLGSRLSHCTASQAVLNCATAITVDRFLMDSRAASLLSNPKRVAASTILSLAVPLLKNSWTVLTYLSSCWYLPLNSGLVLHPASQSATWSFDAPYRARIQLAIRVAKQLLSFALGFRLCVQQRGLGPFVRGLRRL